MVTTHRYLITETSPLRGFLLCGFEIKGCLLRDVESIVRRLKGPMVFGKRPHESLNNLTPEAHRLMAKTPEISKSMWN